MILYEFSNWESFDGDLRALEDALNGVWQRRPQSAWYSGQDGVEELLYPEEKGMQRFITIDYKSRRIKARNYVGVIRLGKETISILPKVFSKPGFGQEEIPAAQLHLLWWLSYCSKFRFPSSKGDFSVVHSDLLEALIYLFARYTKETLGRILFQAYEELDAELPYMKGRLNIPEYVRRNFSTARWHLLNCTYDSFEIDNLFHRIVRYVARLLHSATRIEESRRLLNDILFLLEDVSDQPVTEYDCQRVRINPLFSDLFPVLDYCKMFLSHSTVYKYKDEISVFAFLLPMDYVFEDFIFGFLKTHFESHFDKVKAQASDLFLAETFKDGSSQGEVFQLRHDILLSRNGKEQIIDTKYKILYFDETVEDRKYGVSQSDLYQMATYGIRRGCSNVHLVYPKPSGSYTDAKLFFAIKDELGAKDQLIRVNIHQVSVVDWDLISFQEGERGGNLKALFHGAEERLKAELGKVIMGD